MAEREVDGTAEKIREEFLTFLENFRDNSPSFLTPTAVAAATNNSFLPTSEPAHLINESATSNLDSQPPNLTEDLPVYRQQLLEMRDSGSNTLYVDYNHIFRFNDILANAISTNYYRFEPYLRMALQAFVESHLPSYAHLSSSNARDSREFWISIYGLNVVHRLRELTTQRVGQLISISGTVTRTSEVRPELFVGTFRCADCHTVMRNIEQQFKFTEPAICSNSQCANRKNWVLLPDQSTFVNWQRVRVQENSHEIPPGSMPRCLDVIARNDMVERAKAGDKCTFIGTLIVVPDVSQLALPGNRVEGSSEGRRGGAGSTEGSGVTGIKSLGVRELTYKLSFLCSMLHTSTQNASSSNIRHEAEDAEGMAGAVDEHGNDHVDPKLLFTDAELADIQQMKNSPNLFSNLVDSVAPSIYGHNEIKTGILLMLFGGVHKVTSEGINLRGDINVCVVGDPGTAKSQFLRYVVGFLPRSVYTSGKASSAAGLTASVLKDEESGDFTIEAGALMLADNGICAIDEFDKMDLHDQVAIHEAMEQQTISIAKAGIQATLNARTSILAAANPIGGRYDRRKTLRQNIAMSAPIMSRFDLFFVILDECEEQSDYAIARHILNVHRFREEALHPAFTSEQIQRYIKYARTIKPKLTMEAASLMVERYTQLRQNDATGVGSSYRMTVRQLESMVRLSEALARLHCDPEIKQIYVQEASRLLKSSIIRVENDAIDLDASGKNWSLAAEALTGVVGRGEEAAEPPKLSLSFEEYSRISNMLIYHLKRMEDLQDLGSPEDKGAMTDEPSPTKDRGTTKSALIEWYLEQIEAEMESEEDYYKRQGIVSSIIERLVHKDGILIELGVRAASGGDNQTFDPTLVVHPNYAFS